MKRLILTDIRSERINNSIIGHYVYLAKDYIRLLIDKCNVLIAGGPIYKKPFKDNYFPLPYDSYEKKNSVKRYWDSLMNCKVLFRNCTTDDIIVFQNASMLTYMIGIILFGRKYHNIYIIAYDKWPLTSCVNKCIYSFAKKHIRGTITSNEKMAQAYGKPYCIVPDYIYSGDMNFDNNSSYNEKKYDFVMLGSMYPDKGIVEAAMSLAGKKCKVLIAGKPYSDQQRNILEELSRKNSNIEIHLGFISREDFNRYIIDSRYCLLNYQGMYMERSSGVVFDALFRGIPIAGHKSFPLKIAQEEGVGYVYEDISKFNPEIILNQQTWNNYRDSIIGYLKKNKATISNLVTFFGM
jgi:glycosyltransferase involved in cell wall biosynthesis